MRSLLFYLSLALPITWAACEKKAVVDIKQEKELSLDQKDRALIAASNRFTISLYSEVEKEYDNEENILLSPYSANVALSVVNNGANGETAKAISSALGYEGLSQEEVNTSHQKLIEGLPQVSAKNILKIANSIWTNDQFSVLPSFLQVANTNYHAKASSLPFVNPDAPNAINGWVKDNTNGKIEQIVDEVSSDDLLYVLNAVYFKGMWQQQFDKELTARETFIKANGIKVLTDFMKNTGEYNVLSTTRYQAVEIPYADNKFSMVLVRSADRNHILNFDVDLQDVIVKPQPLKRKIELVIPKFKFAFDHILNNNLKNLGMGIAFTEQADFLQMISGARAHISIVKQKTFIDVNEEGTEAAAVTSVGVVVTSVPMIETIKFDTPFYFLIKENSSNLILFAGKLNDPTK